jgi:nucleoside-diphosphate-sugar epimerase
MGAIDFTPEELARILCQRVPGFKVEYVPDKRQAIADSWPHSLDDVCARTDWQWRPSYTLADIVDELFQEVPTA